MRQTDFFVKTRKEAPKDEEAINAQFLIRAGFIDKTMAGVYTFLTLGWRVLDKIEDIVREEMNKAGGQEIFMPSLQPKEIWQKTGRWESFDALFKFKSQSGSEYGLGPTHEEVLYSLLTQFISSYRDLPIALYQIQTKFRDEPRAKSGLLRCREFRMKDLYSFHISDKDRNRYYEIMKKAYLKIFKRIGLTAILTEAGGGTFSERSHEFQVVSSAGEDEIFVCEKCQAAINKEIVLKDKIICRQCGRATQKEKAIEVGNIFPLKEKFAKDFNLSFKDADGRMKLVSAGCYGLGTSRAMGTIVEVHHDEKGIIWPEAIAPFKAHFIKLTTNDKRQTTFADKIYNSLQKQRGIEILYDDREDISAGEKFAEADLIGIPYRLVISEKTGDKIEIKKRSEKKAKLVSEKELIKMLKTSFPQRRKNSL